MTKLLLLISLILIGSFLAAGCGETVHGMVKDTRRIGGGVRQVFIRD